MKSTVKVLPIRTETSDDERRSPNNKRKATGIINNRNEFHFRPPGRKFFFRIRFRRFYIMFFFSPHSRREFVNTMPVLASEGIREELQL